MNYAETLAYLYGRLPMFHRIGKAAYKADLSNTHALMEILDHPERDLKCVHVAGTNGKGSTSHLIASVLQDAGYRTGLHTSPHLKDMRERFRIRQEVRTRSAHGRVTAYVLAGMPPVLALLMMIANPKQMSIMFTDPLGVKLVIAGVVLQVFGVLIVRRIVDIQY